MPRGAIFRILSNGQRRDPKIPKTHWDGPSGQSFRTLPRFHGGGGMWPRNPSRDVAT